MDLNLYRVHQIGEIELSDVKVEYVWIHDLPDMKIQFDVALSIDSLIHEGDYHYDDYDEKKLWKIAHANIVNSAGNITDGRAMIDKMSSPLILENINTILKNNPVLLETQQTIALEDILGKELIVDSCYVPIEEQALRKNLMSLSV